MKCFYCNNDIPDGSKRCNYCNAPQEYNNVIYNNINNEPKKKKKSDSFKIIMIFLVFILIFVSAFLILMNCFGTSKPSDNGKNNNQEEQNKTGKEIKLEDKFIGSDSVGYVLIPGNWINIAKYGTYAYGDKDEKTIVKLVNSDDNNDISALSNKYKNTFEEEGYDDITIKLVELRQYIAIQLSGYDASSETSISIWFIDTEDSLARILMISTKEDLNNYMFIPDSYKLEK